EYAQALRRVEVEGGSVRDYASEAGITPNNAAVRLFRARETLRKRVVRWCGSCAERGCVDCSCGQPGSIGCAHDARAREARPSASHAARRLASLRGGAGATVGTLATLHAAAARATAAGLGGGATTGLLLAAAVVLGRHDASPRGMQQAPLPA